MVSGRCAYLTYPKVLTNDQKRHAEYVRVLPTPVFFDGMEPHTEIGIELEAVKMKTALYADRDGRVAQVHVQAGAQVDATDLLVEYGE